MTVYALEHPGLQAVRLYIQYVLFGTTLGLSFPQTDSHQPVNYRETKRMQPYARCRTMLTFVCYASGAKGETLRKRYIHVYRSITVFRIKTRYTKLFSPQTSLPMFQTVQLPYCA